jgi:hypothetical protein
VHQFEEKMAGHRKTLTQISHHLTGENTQRLLALVFEELEDEEQMMHESGSEEFSGVFPCRLHGFATPGTLCVGSSKVSRKISNSLERSLLTPRFV